MDAFSVFTVLSLLSPIIVIYSACMQLQSTSEGGEGVIIIINKRKKNG
jgi:hypothetical protein